MKFKALLLMSGITLFFSCRKNPETVIDNTVVSIPIPLATPVTGSVAGNIIDENNNPVASAQVTVSGTVYTTDSKGFFNTANLTLDQYISTVTVNKPGYYKAIRTFAANATKNYISIKLIPKTLAGTFSSSATGTITLANNSQVLFAANSVNIKSTGVAYNGTVNVYASYIDPTSSDIGATVPGSFIGEDATQIYSLQSAGMIAVELESSAGESLQLAAGKPATVKLAIPSSLQSTALSTIDTWSLNDNGIWIKEGTATKNGGFYEMQASHFSFWNCDRPFNAIYLTLNIKDQNNHILANTYVRLTPTGATNSASTYGITDSLGNVSGLVPANNVLQLDLFANLYNCNNSLYTQAIGPFSTNTNLNITGTITQQQTLSITGAVTDCFGSPVVRGSAIIYADSRAYYTTVVNGSFSLNILHCTPFPIPIQIITIDSIGQQQNTTSYTATQNTLDAGSLSSCGISTVQYINYTVDGNNYSINSLNTSSSFYSRKQFQGIEFYGRESNTKNITFSISGTSTGTFPASFDSLANFTYPRYPIATTTATGTITIYGATGQYIEGFFNLPFSEYSTNINHTCSGTFRVRRNY